MGTLIKSSKYHRASGEVWDEAVELIRTEYFYEGWTRVLKSRFEVPIFKRIFKDAGWDIVTRYPAHYADPVTISLRLA